MTTLDYRKRLSLSGLTPTQKHFVLGIPGARTSTQDSDRITLPPEPLLLPRLEAEIPGLVLTDATNRWRADWLARANLSLTLKQEGVADGDSRLYPYQRTGEHWLRTVRRGILGDEMGLGKTFQALVAANDCRKLLIVTLNIAKRSVWERHLLEYFPDRGVFVADGDRAERIHKIAAGVACRVSPYAVVINHEMLQSRFAKAYHLLYDTVWDCVIVDEAHKFQDHQSSQSMGAQKLQTSALYLLTGTPVWNRPESIFGLLKLIDPWRWSSYWNFVNEYCVLRTTPWATEIVGLKPERLDQLKGMLAPLVLRRTQAQVLPQMPPLRIQTLEYDLPKQVRTAYRTLRKEFRVTAGDGETIRFEPSTSKQFADLRRMCNAPSLLGVNLPSQKLDAVEELIDGAIGEGRKVVVFTWHRDFTNLLDSHLYLLGVPHSAIAGDTPPAKRVANVHNFQHGDTKVLIASIAVAGAAIDLTAASVAIFAEGSYVPADNQQAIKRLHRIGQTTDVMVYRLQARNTVESALWEVSDERSDLADEMLSFREVARRTLAQED